MSAGTSRQIVGWSSSEGGGVSVQVRDSDDVTAPMYEEPLFHLRRHEKIKLAARMGLKPRTDDGRWSTLTNDEIDERIRNHVVGEGVSSADSADNHERDGQSGEGEGDAEGEGREPEQSSADENGERGGNGGEGDDPQPQPPEAKPFEFNCPEEMGVGDDDTLQEQIAKLKEQVEEEQVQQQAHDEAQEEAAEQFAQQLKEWSEREDEREEARQQAEEQAEQEANAALAPSNEEQQQLMDAVNMVSEMKLPELHHEKLPEIIEAIASGEHVYLVGPPGTGKSYNTEVVAELLGWDWGSISFGPQTPESRLWGHISPDHQYRATGYRYAVEGGPAKKGSIFCGDEIDNGHGGITVTLNQTLSGDRVSFPDGVVNVHPNFRMVTTANTWGSGATAEFMGRNALDKAFIDRFVQIEMLPDRDLEAALAHKAAVGVSKSDVDEWLAIVWKLRDNAEQFRIHTVVSFRTVMAGVRLKAFGWSNKRVLNVKCLAGLTDSRREHLLEGVSI